jgi:thiol-disulfide isomerase/thioredoxin
MRALIFLLLFIPAISIAQKPAIIKITDLEKRMSAGNDTTYIVNFWATWCKPCVEELHYFDSITEVYKAQKVKVLLVTMDFAEDMDKKVVPFLQKKKLRSEVMLLDEVNGNYFIPKVDPSWTGAIPATLIRNRSKEYNTFFEKKITYGVLESTLVSNGLVK